MSEQRNPVVASLANRSQHPYSSIAVSPDRSNGIAAGKDTLRVFSLAVQGLREVRSLRISQHFQQAVAQPGAKSQSRYRENFKQNSPQNLVSSTSNVVTDVAWSLPQDGDRVDSSVVAAAGSNGAVIVWNAEEAFLDPSAATAMGPPPDAVLSQHARAVNRLAWHPNKRTPGFLLTASQDATVKLWERKSSSNGRGSSQPNQNLISWFGKQASRSSLTNSSISWHCLATFEPKAEAVRDIRWSPFHDNIFAMVTVTGSLLVYDINHPETACVRIQAHDGEATSCDWHPSNPGIIATGGAGDRCVKVWILTLSLSASISNPDQPEDICQREESNSRIWTSSGSSLKPMISSKIVSTKIVSSGHSINSGRKGNTKPAHILYVSASVTRIKWRPPAGTLHAGINSHESMLAVATSPIKGDHAGGNGLLSLWSYSRPYMALSVVEGHKEGAVTDFLWLDIPPDENSMIRPSNEMQEIPPEQPSSIVSRIGTPVFGSDSNIRSRDPGTPIMGSSRRRGRNSMDDMYSREREIDKTVDDSDSLEGTWQHVLSVGRDGRCILQSFVRGDRPISRVSPSCFAVANLSPFQPGYGSLQVFSVHHNVPHGRLDDYALTGLRQDAAISKAPGVFREPTISSSREGVQQDRQIIMNGQKIPNFSPRLTFNVIDQGDLNDESRPMMPHASIVVAPEVVHLSRFASSYKLYPDDTYQSGASLCLHNASVAETQYCGSLARMWRTLATMLNGSGLSYLPPVGAKAENALQFSLAPCVRKLLEERANVGDVQTCVALCEVLQVLQGNETKVSSCIPGLPVSRIREWYFSYIDLLQEMCLFSHASFLIGKCKDPAVGALNKQSTVIHESCPHCRKPLLVGDGDGIAQNQPGANSMDGALVAAAKGVLDFASYAMNQLRAYSFGVLDVDMEGISIVL
eukprot:CAMPEP_0194214342 /NCGR_PEP_ID=MMETSP0156-20130528/15499_1 /TAXON_ID=33649 /ORGANISM="Thalassionema nitzschioides, Strain L26-B" /LENGTH=918 /DNA_ID=CAMNT_0038942573 /DNA_START=52 /DNA_END=2809 /DNA_ORIENTATION=-